MPLFPALGSSKDISPRSALMCGVRGLPWLTQGQDQQDPSWPWLCISTLHSRLLTSRLYPSSAMLCTAAHAGWWAGTQSWAGVCSPSVGFIAAQVKSCFQLKGGVLWTCSWPGITISTDGWGETMGMNSWTEELGTCQDFSLDFYFFPLAAELSVCREISRWGSTLQLLDSRLWLKPMFCWAKMGKYSLFPQLHHLHHFFQTAACLLAAS